MANLNFFAARSDIEKIISFLLAETDVRIFEHYSEMDQDLREFKSFAELSAAFRIGEDKFGNGTAITLSLLSPSVQELRIRTIGLDPKKCDGHRARYELDGYALMQLYLGGIYERILTISHFGHQSETRARKWGYTSGVDWEALKRVSNKVQYHIRGRLSIAKAASCPVLPAAYELANDGFQLKFCKSTTWTYEPRLLKSSNK